MNTSLRLRKLLLLAFVLLSGASAIAGTTSVTLTGQDSSAQVFANGTYRIFFRPTPFNNGPYTVGGASFPSGPFIGSLNASGQVVIVLTDNLTIQPGGSQWIFTVCPNASATCATNNVTVTGGSQSVTVVAPTLSISAPAAPLAYTDGEISNPVNGSFYYNTLSNALRVFSNGWTSAGVTFPLANGTVMGWSDAGISRVGPNSIAFGNGAALDVTAALNAGNLVINKAQGNVAAPNIISVTTNAPSTSDNASGTLSVTHNITATSAVNDLIERAFAFGTNNSLTGGGHVQNYRNIDLTAGSLAGSVTDSHDAIYIETGSGQNGTVTTGRGLRIASLPGTTKIGILDAVTGSFWRLQSDTSIFQLGALNDVSYSRGAAGRSDFGDGGQNANGIVNSAGYRIANAATNGNYLRGNGTSFVSGSIAVGDVPTLNQSTTGTASNITGIAAEANGGTGANNTTGAAGHYLRSNGTHYVDSAIVMADLPNRSFQGASTSLADSTLTEQNFSITYTFGANYFTAGKVVKVFVSFEAIVGGTASSTLIKGKLGGIQGYTNGGQTSGTASVTRQYGMEIYIRCITTGSSGTFNFSTTAPGNGVFLLAANNQSSDITVNTTISNALQFTVTYGATNANSIIQKQLNVEELN